MDFGRCEVERAFTRWSNELLYHSQGIKGLSCNHLVESSLMWSSFMNDIKETQLSGWGAQQGDVAKSVLGSCRGVVTVISLRRVR